MTTSITAEERARLRREWHDCDPMIIVLDALDAMAAELATERAARERAEREQAESAEFAKVVGRTHEGLRARAEQAEAAVAAMRARLEPWLSRAVKRQGAMPDSALPGPCGENGVDFGITYADAKALLATGAGAALLAERDALRAAVAEQGETIASLARGENHAREVAEGLRARVSELEGALRRLWALIDEAEAREDAEEPGDCPASHHHVETLKWIAENAGLRARQRTVGTPPCET